MDKKEVHSLRGAYYGYPKKKKYSRNLLKSLRQKKAHRKRVKRSKSLSKRTMRRY